MKKTNNKGITLVALVITIIVLLILAGVSLSMVLSQDGIFSRAEKATEKYGQAKARETLEMQLSEAQMRKYESGLTDKQLDEEISKVGSLIPKEDENSKYQLVIVEGHIFEIDRSVPKIVDYKGPANGVIITAKITQNGDWENPVATVTGAITKYGGGSVVSTTVTATNGVTIPVDFPTTGGSYTIPNITTDTDITINTTDSEGKTNTRTVKVVLLRDTTSPIISEEKAEVILNKITITAKAVDTESGLASFRYSVSPTTVKDSKATGSIEPNGTPIVIETTELKNYTVTFTATDNAGNTSTVTAEPVTTTDTLSVAEAKQLVTDKASLQEYIGTKVDYKDGETWQIFYYDEEVDNTGAGEFGPANTLYLKKIYSSKKLDKLTVSNKTEMTDPAVDMMARMNPMWASSTYNEIDQVTEKVCVWLCDPEVWNTQRNESYSSFAIGSPSIEMVIKAFVAYDPEVAANVDLDLCIPNKFGYEFGTVGDCTMSTTFRTEDDFHSPIGLDPFWTESWEAYWLCSPSGSSDREQSLHAIEGRLAHGLARCQSFLRFTCGSVRFVNNGQCSKG